MEPDWIVLRFSPQFPREIIPRDLEGRWIDRATVHDGKIKSDRVDLGTAATITTSIARPTGRFEYDDQWHVAEVWEVEPQPTN